MLGRAIHNYHAITWRKSEPYKTRGTFSDPLLGAGSWTEARAKVKPYIIFNKPSKNKLLRVRFL